MICRHPTCYGCDRCYPCELYEAKLSLVKEILKTIGNLPADCRDGNLSWNNITEAVHSKCAESGLEYDKKEMDKKLAEEN